MFFTKMHGCGNDYVYVDGSKEIIEQSKKSEIARIVSDRHFGIGSDGLIFINPVDDDSIDFEMEMYNADGSRSEMCGNGIRCVAKYVYDNRLTDKTDLVIVSAGKKKYINLEIGTDNLVFSVKVDMGAPILAASEVPVAVKSDISTDRSSLPSATRELLSSMPDIVIDTPVIIDGKEWKITCVSMGNPHAVVFLPEDVNLDSFEIEKIGPRFENNSIFPNRTNTEFVKVDDRGNVHMRVWERGTGETLACGTGCCATTVACVLNGLTDNRVAVHVLGGIVTCTWDGNAESSVIMEGPATTVFTGEIDL
ncbi:diaminopimelate epimerase DapF [Butyrivibrio proteoclasticus B316]|uniref:Diaminopimelate epimerase n=1 Tax=Butyrivibrio proteoclasticus (strain ATCC 51982 / DSM 14932 / B316) TaxID=515622 RepID=E0RZK5_BUTPB|nr:diaminopimelate epimerase [Butyrivibrio proteoclasticus]ADL35121.1 diaminopimelate epimerase DapF [Butyrivibrio proteoclasticus B316]